MTARTFVRAVISGAGIGWHTGLGYFADFQKLARLLLYK